MEIRRARPADADAITAFTTETFDWGDYIPSLISDWIADEDGIVMVAVVDDTPVAMARALLLTDTEAWSHAARVHPDYRGRGIAGDLADELMVWASDQGAKVVRLMIEDDNLASIRHITKKDFRRAVSVVRATRTVGAASPNPEGNGGRRNPSGIRARPGKAQDLTLVRSSWSTSEVGRLLRGLVASGWTFHRLTDSDIEHAARSGALWEVGNSWAITDSIEPTFQLAMLDTFPDEAYDVIRALIDTANNRGAESFAAFIADTDWLVQAARRAGCEVEGYGIWERSL